MRRDKLIRRNKLIWQFRKAAEIGKVGLFTSWHRSMFLENIYAKPYNRSSGEHVFDDEYFALNAELFISRHSLFSLAEWLAAVTGQKDYTCDEQEVLVDMWSDSFDLTRMCAQDKIYPIPDNIDAICITSGPITRSNKIILLAKERTNPILECELVGPIVTGRDRSVFHTYCLCPLDGTEEEGNVFDNDFFSHNVELFLREIGDAKFRPGSKLYYFTIDEWLDAVFGLRIGRQGELDLRQLSADEGWTHRLRYVENHSITDAHCNELYATWEWAKAHSWSTNSCRPSIRTDEATSSSVCAISTVIAAAETDAFATIDPQGHLDASTPVCNILRKRGRKHISANTVPSADETPSTRCLRSRAGII